ncbi:putative L-PSP endoribonuclease family protein [Polychaeton citri CBS 116435]|uniref:L-PSP endoribonuclease family protein n=1 Tax=Polychaeton citri CBS 116435 TaxID=1314669 RepID=A0A9P4URB6_9PEZI|nr:putative L-PSP endoribonuclease family protein [Polychaeton citri CBS 116435]
MSHLTYLNSGISESGDQIKETLGYSQAVKVGNFVEISGQGDMGAMMSAMSRDLRTQIAKAFENVDLILKKAGAEKGWGAVYKVRSYHVPLNDEALELMKENYQKWLPDHAPTWTALGVQRLGLDDMRIEIEVTAHIE